MKTILVLIFVLTVEVLFNTDKRVPNSYYAQYIFYLYIFCNVLLVTLEYVHYVQQTMILIFSCYV